MYEFFAKLLNMSLTAGVLVIAIVLLRLVLKKAPKKYICILWALVALRLVLPIGISSSLSVFNLMNTETSSSGQIEYFSYNGKTEKPTLNFDVVGLVNDNYSPDSMTVGTRTAGMYLPTVMYIWLFGVVAMLAYAVISYIQLRKQVAASICREDKVYVCDEIKSPFILGIIRPLIYIPSGLTAEIEKNVLAHEKTHLKRLDHLWKPFGYFLLSIYWFNPILWVAYILLCKDIETACDEKVIESMDKGSIAGYSEALLACAVKRRMITACPVAFGETDAQGRIKNVLNYKKPAFWIVAASVIVCIVAAVCFLTNPKESSYSIKIVIPANSQGQFYYSDEEISPIKNLITVYSGEGVGDTEVVLMPVEVKEENSYEPTYITHAMPVEMEAEKGGWFTIGIWGENSTNEDKELFLTVKNIIVRIADGADTSEIRVLKAIVTEVGNGRMLVEPVEGSEELRSSNLFSVPIEYMEASPEPSVGDLVEISYCGGILEVYPSLLENITHIRVVEKGNLEIVNVYKANTDSEEIQEGEFVIFETFYELSDGTWSTGTHSYKYRLEITGRSGAAVRDTTYLYLSNIEEISYRKAMMAAGFSSNSDDYFDEKDAKYIGYKK